MAKGKKHKPETVYAVMLSYFVTGNYNETAEQLGLAESTVRTIVERNKDNPEFAKLRIEKQSEFVERADGIIYQALELLERRFKTALESQDALDEMLDMIADNDISKNQQKALMNKLYRLQLNNLSEITTALGTMYDKRALAKGEPTSNETLTINVELTD